MKTGTFAMCLSLLATGCPSKDPQAAPSKDLQATPPEVEMLGLRDAGWVVYDGGGWTETASTNIALLGGSASGNCECNAGEFIHFERALITEFQVDGSLLSSKHLHGMEKQHYAGGASGIIVTNDSRSYLITTKHAAISDVCAITDYSLNNVTHWGPGDKKTIAVPCENTIKCRLVKIDEINNTDIMACEVDRRFGGLKLTTNSVMEKTQVQTFMHPFGLPLKTSKVEVSNCISVHCWAPFDNAVGGSGGAVLMDGMLAGIILGTDVHSNIVDGQWVPCGCSPRGSCHDENDKTNPEKCEYGQKFLTSQAIRAALKNGYP
ncbi:hypothetical protein ACNOYE_32400 [Nannocystaceae bacterium ST9]